jgi:hypothetical protein
MTRRRLNVTQDDIDLGTRMSTRNCPIARAARRAGINRPAVCADAIVDAAGDEWELSGPAQEFVAAYDMNFHVAPHRFTIERLDD